MAAVDIDSTSVNSTNSEGERRGGLFPIFRRRKERAPLLIQRRLFRSLSGRDRDRDPLESHLDGVSSTRTLSMFGGVFAPVALSQFSSLLFLRVGFIVGNAGLILAGGTLVLSYSNMLFTMLSICALSTNGAVEGGGAYYMISRTLGPEFGGAIGALFFMANIFSSALYITGCVEGIVQNFGESGTLAHFLPEGQWCDFGYGSCLNVLNLLVCLIGAGMFAKTTVAILFAVLFCMASVVVSFLAIQHEVQVAIPASNTLVQNATNLVNGTYTGFSAATLRDNTYPSWGLDYTAGGNAVDFATVFGVLFSGVTGIMAGANMSGELRHPGKSIPLGTLGSSLFTFLTYLLLFFFTAATCERFLLQNNYVFMMGINLWPPFVMAGMITATISASMSNSIGSSRVLAALVKDDIYGPMTRWMSRLNWGSNPIGAVLVSSIMVELVLLIGRLNTIAKFTSIFFLLSHLAMNLACLVLEWASAPNFRPSFIYFAWWTATLGLVGNIAMMFVISPTAAGICIIVCLVLVIILHLRSPSEEHQWGSISQALIFHQVRKYLLLLDTRKDHVKFWRPQMLLMVANARSACPLIDFANDLKKSGLYILGHVKVSDYDGNGPDPAADDYPKWMALVDHLKVKAFVEVTVARTVREGLRHLARVAGLGAMKPNMVLFGFFDSTPSQDFFNRESSPFQMHQYQTQNINSVSPSLLGRVATDGTDIGTEEYVSMINDVINMGKNVCLCRHFHLMDKEAILKSSPQKKFIDVWPMDFFNPDPINIFGTTSLFIMQLATILNMVSSWRKRTQLRVFLCVSSSDADPEMQEKQVQKMLHDLRIKATIVSVPFDYIASHLVKPPPEETCSSDEPTSPLSHLTDEYIGSVSHLLTMMSVDTAVTFLDLPRPPESRQLYPRYLHLLTAMTEGLRPTVLVHGVSAVTTTNL